MKQEILRQLEERINKAIEYFQNEMRSVRTGRASTMLVEDIKVEVWGQTMRLRDIASLTVPDATSILIIPWDKNNLKPIEEALEEAKLGVGVVNTGENIRVTLPELSIERREELKKMVEKKAEEIKISMRNARREAVEEIKKMEKEKEISEDERNRLEKEIQKLLDEKIGDLEELVEKKKGEIEG